MRRILCAGLLLAGCASPAGDRSGAPLLVGAPPSMREPFEQIAAAFQIRHPEQPVTVLYGSVGELTASGALLDVIAADDPDALAPLGARLVERRDWAANPLLLVEKSGAPPVTLRSVPDRSWVGRIAIADGRSDPAGAAAEALLGRVGLRRALDARLLYVGTGAKALDRVASGEAQVGFARASDLVGRVGLTVAERLTDDARSRYPVAIWAQTPRLTAARQFLDELSHGDGPKAFAARGLLSPSAR